ncbi:imidazole glycerol phosphate synthase subunit HisH [Pelagibacterales bacterium]|nr:imidazole glycerol phosphate synthase subunit HisH [Pelagibacterales bacterium]
MIGIIDYGSGNIQAIRNIYKRLKIKTFIINKPKDVSSATKLILPGVGAFDEAIDKLDQSGLRTPLDEAVLKKKIPVMGICVGMQIMADESEEGSLKGLGWISGSVKRFDINQINIVPKLPHMGWNNISFSANPIFNGIDKKTGFYFLHSYFFKAKTKENVIATSFYHHEFHCALNQNNIFGFQFHPEKSHSNGIKLFKNFSAIVK